MAVIQTVNLSKETMDLISPALQSILTSIESQTSVIQDTFNLQSELGRDAERARVLGEAAGESGSAAAYGLAGGAAGGAAGGFAGDGMEASANRIRPPKAKGFGLGSMLGGAMKGLGSLGIAAGGLGALFAGGGYLLEKIEEMDGKKIKNNVVELLGIREALGEDSKMAFVGEGASFAAAMTGIGAGLGVFAIGSAAAAGVDAFAGKSDWATNVVSNVSTLLTLKDAVGADSKMAFAGEGAAFGAAMTGIGAGLLIFGAGSAAIAGVDAFSGESKWTSEVVSNVSTLLSLKDSLGGNASLLVDGGAFSLAMTGIGAGLGIFAIGSAAMAGASALSTKGWAEGVKDSVTTLLGIKDELGGSISMLADGLTFAPAMSGIAAGLGVFAAGTTAMAGADAISKDGWAKGVKGSVGTLLSIQDDLGGNWAMLKSSGAFALAMGGISAGLIAFSVGSATSATSEATSNALNMFTGTDDWAATVKERVGTLLSISSDTNMGGDAKTFAISMAGISAGLLAFSLGTTASAGAAGIDGAISKFTDNENFADRIYGNVKTLLGVTDLVGEGGESKASKFAGAMAKISGGLLMFTAGELVNNLASAGGAILGFLTGSKSPFEKISGLADDSEKLLSAADALERIAGAMNTFGNISVKNIGDMKFKELAINLAESIPFFRALATGGVLNDGWFDGAAVDFGEKGLLDPALRLDELSSKIAQINFISGKTGINPTSPEVASSFITNYAMSASDNAEYITPNQGTINDVNRTNINDVNNTNLTDVNRTNINDVNSSIRDVNRSVTDINQSNTTISQIDRIVGNFLGRPLTNPISEPTQNQRSNAPVTVKEFKLGQEQRMGTQGGSGVNNIVTDGSTTNNSRVGDSVVHVYNSGGANSLSNHLPAYQTSN